MPNVDYGESAVHVTIALTSHDTEYSFQLPGQVKGIEFQSRDATDIRYSIGTSGKVAASTDPYHTLKSGQVYAKDLLFLGPITLYFACGSDSKNVELTYWL